VRRLKAYEYKESQTNFLNAEEVPAPGCDLIHSHSHMQSRHVLRDPHYLSAFNPYLIDFSPSKRGSL